MNITTEGRSKRTAVITGAGTVYVLMLLPEWFGRLLLFFITHSIYRVKVIGRENFPEKTGALLVCNHMSFVDAALLIASTDRPIRFVMYQGIYDNPIVKPVADRPCALVNYVERDGIRGHEYASLSKRLEIRGERI